MRGDTGYPVRIRFSKRGKVRFVSHRDLARSFERAFRVARLPMAFTQGFSPRPKVSLGLALGVGHESDAEYIDLELLEPIDLAALPNALGEALPEGVVVTGAVALVPRAPALQEAVTTVEYELRPAGLQGAALRDAVHEALTAHQISIETTRKGRPVVEDLRPGIRHLAELDDGSLHAELATKPRGIRPTELFGALYGLVGIQEEPASERPRVGYPDSQRASHGGGEDRVLRTKQWIERDGARHEPLAADRAPCTSDDVHGSSKGPTHVGRHDHPLHEPHAELRTGSDRVGALRIA